MQRATLGLFVAGIALAAGLGPSASARAGDTALRFERDGALLGASADGDVGLRGEARAVELEYGPRKEL